MALPKRNRIKSKKDIDRLFRSGKNIKGGFLFIRFLHNQKGYPRFVFIVPAKHVPLAAERNKVKRMFSREIITSGVMQQQGYDIGISVFRKVIRGQLDQLREELKDILSRAAGLSK